MTFSVTLTARRLATHLASWLTLILHRLSFLWTSDKQHRHLLTSVNHHANVNNSPRMKTKTLTVRDIPGPFVFPYYGSFRPKFKDVVIEKYSEELFHKYGPIVKFEFLNNIPVIFLLDAEDCKKILYECSAEIRPPIEIMAVYRKSRPDRYDTVGVVNVNGPEWEKLHKNLAKITLNHTNVATLNESFNEIISDLIKSISSDKNGAEIDIYDYCNRLAVECSFETYFNMRMGLLGPNETSPDSKKMLTLFGDYFSSFHKSLTEWSLWKYVPTSLWNTYARMEDEMLDLIEKFIQTCRKNNGGSVILKKILELDMSYKSKRLSILELLNGATDPVLNQLIFTLYEICRNDRVDAKVFEELKAAMPTKGTFVYDADISKLPYLRACINETSRISPAAPNIARVTNKPTEIRGYHLPPYTVIMAQTLFAALSPDMFYNPKEFLPERWLGGAANAAFHPHRPDVVTAFGTNRRACPGRKIYTSLATIFLARILRTHKITFVKELEPTYDFLRCVKAPVYVTIQDRPN